MPMAEVVVHVGLGSNMGDRGGTLLEALKMLDDLDGAALVLGRTTATAAVSTAIAVAPTVPEARLCGSHPHPMVERTTIAFEVPGDGRGGAATRASITVYDLAGRVVRRLLDAALPPGRHEASWDGTTESGERVASGCYLYTFTAAGESETGKLLVVR